MQSKRIIFDAALLANVPVYLTGTPGTAKTAYVRQYAERRQWNIQVLQLNLMEPEDLLGLPVNDAGVMRYLTPSWIAQITKSSLPTVLFLDELNTARPATQAAALRLVLERAVGEAQLPASTRIVAAGNPVGQSPGATPLAPALANRFVHLPALIDADAFVKWLEGGDGDNIVAIEPPAGDVAEEHYRRWRSSIAGFLRLKPDYAALAPSPGTLAFPTYRSWDMAARLLAVLSAASYDEQLYYEALLAAVGIQAADAFFRYCGR
jgi:MoxR-like ATPase